MLNAVEYLEIADELEIELESDRLGSERHRRDVVFQPVFDLGREEVIAYEALARLPGIGLGLDLELAAVEAALEYAGDLPPGVRLGLNVSPAAAASHALFFVLEGVADCVLIELTEREDVEDYGALKRGLEALRARGALVAIDDAGTGFSTFERMLRLGPDVVKVDLRAPGLVADPTRRALVAALIFFASTTNATIVAEGIETRGELNVVRRLEIAYGQGSWLGVPGPLPCAAR